MLIFSLYNLQTNDTNVLKIIYCEVCNIGLDKSDNHYSTETHQRFAFLFLLL